MQMTTKFLEKDLEQIIFEMSKDKRMSHDLYLFGKPFRQFRIPSVGIGTGIVDLMYVERPVWNPIMKRHEKGVINIVELKKRRLDHGSFFQAVRYADSVREFLLSHKNGWFENLFHISITLIGVDGPVNIDLQRLCKLFPSSFDGVCDIESETRVGVDIYLYKYTDTGIQFKHCLKDE